MSQNLVLCTVNICHTAPKVIGITARANRCPHRTHKANRLATGHALLSIDLPWLWAHRLGIDTGKNYAVDLLRHPLMDPTSTFLISVAKLEIQTKRFLLQVKLATFCCITRFSLSTLLRLPQNLVGL